MTTQIGNPTSTGQELATPNGDTTGDIALAFVGSVFPDKPEYRTEAFSPSGRMFQENLLHGLENAGLPPTLVISFISIPSFPRSRRLWIRGDNVLLDCGIPVKLVSFINVTPIKQLAIGLATAWNLLKWGWRTRKARHVVYQYNLTVPPGLFTLLATRLIGASAVVSLNDINIPGQTIPHSVLNRLDFWLQRKLIPRFDGHIVVTDAIMRDFVPGRAYLRVEGGVAPVLFETVAPSPSARTGCAPFTVAFAGSLDPVNGIDILLEAFSQLQGDGYRLVIAGWGPEEGAVRAAAATDHRICFLGVLPFAELLRVYMAADVLVSMRPTKTMQTEYFFPGKMMEYLASGTPLIATCTGHTEEEFGDICYLLKDESAQGLERMLSFVADIPPNVRMEKGLQARAYMKNNKTWDGQARRIVQFIRETAPTSEIRMKAV